MYTLVWPHQMARAPQPTAMIRSAFPTGLSRVAVAMLLLIAFVDSPLHADAGPPAQLVFCCQADNDLYRIIKAAGANPPRFDDPTEAVRRAPAGGGVLILADGYPHKTTEIPSGLLQISAERQLRLLLEFPAAIPGLTIGPPRTDKWQRAVVASDWFASTLQELSILAIHDCHFVPVDVNHSHLVLARVAGYNKAVFGLPEQKSPILFEHPAHAHVLVATTKLSQMLTARYAPADAWMTVWRTILAWLQPGRQTPSVDWTPLVRPTYKRDEPLPADAERQALRRGIEWFFTARMLIHPAWQEVYDDQAAKWQDRVGPAPKPDWPCGDGSLGVLEGFASHIDWQGQQPVRWWRRHDCNGETAGAMALAGDALGEPRYKTVAANMADWLYGRSILSQGNRANPQHPAFGLLGWNDVPRYWGELDGYGVYYGDDNARGLLGVMTAAVLLKTDRWDERAMRGLLANLRLAGRLGFQLDRLDEGPLQQQGWRHFLEASTVSYDMNYQAYPWACHLATYRQTKYRPLLDRAKSAIRMTMEAYPDKWRWTESMQMERARILLPLAWLVRVEDTAEHRRWLRRIAEDLLQHQMPSGAIREALGPAGQGVQTPPKSNAEYGTAEATLIQNDGDPAADLLYTSNFALLGLHEAAAATADDYYRAAEDRLVAMLCRVQVRAPEHPQFDGAWFRALDFDRWEYWASNADAGWGAWSIETGWKQSWITAVLALRQLHTSLWDVTSAGTLGRQFESARQQLQLPL